MKNLLLISHSSSATGGGEEDFLRLLKFFQGRYNLIGIFPEGDRVDEYKNYVSDYLVIPNRMFPFTKFNLRSYAGYFIKAFSKIKLINSFLSNKKIDLAYIHSSVCLYETYTIINLGIPYVLSVREFINPIYVRNKFYNFYLKSSAKIIVISKSLEEEFKKLNIDQNKIELIYPSIERIQIEGSNFNNDVTILNIGNIFPPKGQDKVIEAISRIKDLNKKVILKIIGANVDENYFKHLNKLVHKYNLNSEVIFTGELPREKVLQEIAKANFVIISSYQEGFSLVLLEALSLKRPVISTKVGVIPEVIIDNENGLLYDYQNSELLAQKINLLLRNNGLYKKISNNGFETFNKMFDLNRSLKRHDEVFQNILHRSIN